MKHLGFVGKSTEYLGYTHVEIINSSLRLSFNIPSKNDLKETFKKMVENNYDLLMETSAEIEFDLESETALLHKGLKDRVILSNSILSDNLGVRSA
ncbi:hypothetical protein LZ086_18950 (plasmid) [Acinetobacter johnsonii]|nr:hypothetical protein LZ086_18950 [Acinetobacter johnsonii]